MNEIKEFKVIVAGSRGFRNYSMMERTLDNLLRNKSNITIISGGAEGADHAGETYAINHNLKLTVMSAEWDKYGKSAGYKRNVQMADQADAVVVFWDGVSRGTKHMIDIAGEKKLPMRIVKF